MNKPRRFAVINNAQVRIGTTPASVREILIDIVSCAEYNRENSEEKDSPTYLDQDSIVRILKIASDQIDKECREHWKEK